MLFINQKALNLKLSLLVVISKKKKDNIAQKL